MADFYERMRALAIRLISGYGADAVLQIDGPAVYNPATSTPTKTTTSHTGRAVRVQYKIEEIDGTDVRRDDMKLLLSPAEGSSDMPVPKRGDRVLFDGKVYNAISVSPWNFNGLNLGFTVQARV